MPKANSAPVIATPKEEDWIAAAREMLIEGGVAAVEVNRLASWLGVTRGGFYWRFKNRQDLLHHLLKDWHQTNNKPLFRAAKPPGTPRERMARVIALWIDGNEFNAALDAAVRDWARIDSTVEKTVRNADDLRIKALSQIFLDAGQDAEEARVRGRVIYYHQVGYFTLGVKETRAQRLKLVPIYNRIMTGLG